MRLIGRIFMSAVTLLCADRPCLYESGVRRVETSSHGGTRSVLRRADFSVVGSTHTTGKRWRICA